MSHTRKFEESGFDRDLAANIAEDMLAAASSDDRWSVVLRTLEALGATSVNAAAICDQQVTPLWFRSSLPRSTLEDYVSEGFVGSDFIIKHSVSSSEVLRWQTSRRSDYETDPSHHSFGNFVRDTGTRSITSMSQRMLQNSCFTTITYCSTLDPGDVMAPQNQHRVETAIQLLLPWILWPEDVSSRDLLKLRTADLSPREAQALRLLAGGLMNARIADAMGISEAMVAKHLQSARRKLDAKTREEAVAKAIRSARLSS